METEFLEFMPFTVAIAKWLGTDFHGTEQWDTNPNTYPCRIVGKGLALRRAGTEEDAIIVDIYFDPGDTIITPRDQVYLPPSQVWIDDTPVIFSVGRFTDPMGQHHCKVQCGWQYHRQGQ